jgi:hypothetical protein
MTVCRIKSKLTYIFVSLCSFFYVLSSCTVNKDLQVVEADADKFFKRGGEIVTFEELKEGSKLYVLKCGNCHNLILPSKYTAAEWEKEYLPKEWAKAQVEDAQEKKKIAYFIYAKAKQPAK